MGSLWNRQTDNTLIFLNVKKCIIVIANIESIMLICEQLKRALQLTKVYPVTSGSLSVYCSGNNLLNRRPILKQSAFLSTYRYRVTTMLPCFQKCSFSIVNC